MPGGCTATISTTGRCTAWTGGHAQKYGELVDRVRDRAEFSDLIAEMVSELSALHASWRRRSAQGPDQVPLAALGALLVRERRRAASWCSTSISPIRTAPTACRRWLRPGVEINEGDVLLSINGRDVIGRRSGRAAAQPGGQAGPVPGPSRARPSRAT